MLCVCHGSTLLYESLHAAVLFYSLYAVAQTSNTMFLLWRSIKVFESRGQAGSAVNPRREGTSWVDKSPELGYDLSRLSELCSV